MKKQNKKRAAANAVIVNHSPSEFKPRVDDRAGKLVEAVKPITDKWYVRFSKAAKSGNNELILTMGQYWKVLIATSSRNRDDIFRLAALEMIYNGLLFDLLVLDEEPTENTTPNLIEILKENLQFTVRSWFPRNLFKEENCVFDLACEILTLGSEYRK